MTRDKTLGTDHRQPVHAADGMCLTALRLGSTRLSSAQIFDALFHDQDSVTASIILGIRLPGDSGHCRGRGVECGRDPAQGLFRNPLVEPYTLGISGGASLGVCIAILTGLPALLGVTAYPLAGFAGAGIVIVLVYGLGLRTGRLQPNTMLLIGVMISFVSSSLVMLLMAVSEQDDLSKYCFLDHGVSG